jgi:hypothetical protein
LLTPIILGTQEAGISRIVDRGQPGQTVHEIISQKYPTQERADGVAQVVEHETLSSNPSIAKTKTKQSDRNWVQVTHTCNPSYLGS